MTAPRLAAAMLCFAAALAAQTPAPRAVDGRVMRGSARGRVPVPDRWVVLHRVGADSEGPIDSARTAADGSYRLRYRPFGASDAVYFVATMYDGIAYLSSPLKAPRVTGLDAEIDVFDTTSTGIALHERGRHVLISSPRAGGVREVYEVYELENGDLRTLVPGGANRPSWTAPIVASATRFHAQQGEISPAAVVAADGKVDVFAPFAPGVKQLAFSYDLPPSAFPLALPPARDTLVLEVLLEEPGASATGVGLRKVSDQMVEGRRFTRYLSPNAPPDARVRILAPTSPATSTPLAVLGLVVVLAGMMAVGLYRGLRPDS